VVIWGAEAELVREISATFPVAAAVNTTLLVVATPDDQPDKEPENV